MRLLFEMMQAKQKEAELRKLTGKYKYEYDSDEETEGGTWEHKKRAMEMQKTQSLLINLNFFSYAVNLLLYYLLVIINII